MSETVSLLLELHDLLEKKLASKEFTPHLLVATEATEDGKPMGAVVKLKASPFMALGMIEVIMEKLAEARENVLQDLRDLEDHSAKEGGKLSTEIINDFFDKTKDYLSPDVKAFLEDIQKRAEKAMSENNGFELMQIMKEMREFREKYGKGGNPGGFNLDDFKGSF